MLSERYLLERSHDSKELFVQRMSWQINMLIVTCIILVTKVLDAINWSMWIVRKVGLLQALRWVRVILVLRYSLIQLLIHRLKVSVNMY